MTPTELEVVQRQYDTYVLMAEKLVDRRAEANRFYLTLHSGLIIAIGFLLREVTAGEAGGQYAIFFYALPIGGIFLCFVWRGILQSQRKIMKSKFAIIHQLEATLPVQPYKDEDAYTAPKGGARRGVSFGRQELRTPWAFAALYLVFLGNLTWTSFGGLPHLATRVLDLFAL
jgi:hypothetical protein